MTWLELAILLPIAENSLVCNILGLNMRKCIPEPDLCVDMIAQYLLFRAGIMDFCSATYYMPVTTLSCIRDYEKNEVESPK